MDKEKLWTKEFISTSLVNFVLMLSMYLLLVTMAGYAMLRFDASTGMAGLVASIFIIGVLGGRLYAGRQIRKYGTKKMLMIGIIIFVVMSLFYFFDFGIYALLLVRIIQGAGLGLATTATGTIVSQVIPPSRNGEGISYFSISVVLSTAIGPLIGILLIEAFNYTSIFIFSTTVGVLSLIMAWTIQVPVVEQQEEETTKKGFRLGDYFEKRALPISFALFVVAFGYAGILSFISTFSEEIGLVEAGGMFFLVYAVVILVTRPFTGKLMDVKGANSIAYPGIIIAAIGMFTLSQATTSFVLLLSAVLIGLGYGNYQSCTQAVAIKVTPIERMGLANSTYFISLDFALGMGPLILGLIEPITGYRGMYAILGGVILVGLVVYHFMHGRADKQLMGIVDKRAS
ncbi:MAG TPA: MFS transporter [Pseudogracilibacillus sp.]|nr:MFS transporter [Pseudogracilibacillus sp.]